MQNFITAIFILLVSFGGSQSLQAQADCLPKPGKQLVNDYSRTLSKSQVAQLENKLVAFNKETSNQILVIMTDDLCNYEPMEYATNIGHAWGVGQNKFDNGIVLLVTPKQRKTFIAVGYGLEGAIPDAISKRIVNQELLPYFRNDDYFGGVDQATNVLMQLAKGEISAENYGAKNSKDSPGLALLLILFIVLFIFVFGIGSSARKYSKANDVSFLTAMMLLMATRNSHGGSYGNFRSGRGGFGGGGGGGFGGFGGGGFGGGGAGGSW